MAFDPISANARTLGSYQEQAVQKLLVSGFMVHKAKDTNFGSRVNTGNNRSALSLNLSAAYADYEEGDAGMNVGNGKDTRPSNTAFHLRLVSY